MEAGLGQLLAFHLRLGGPGEDVVVTAHVLHEFHRFAAAGVAVAGLAVPLLLRQARQHLLHVQPAIRIQALGFGQAAGIEDVGDADVVGGQGEPGAIRFVDAVGQLVADLVEVLGAAGDALLGIQAIGHAHGLGGIVGQHHQAAHPGLGGGVRRPQRFLVAHGGEQAPVQLMRLRHLAKVLLVLGQAFLQVLGEGVGAHVAEHVDVAVVAFLELLQGAVAADLVEVGVDRVEQAVVLAGLQRPGLALVVAEVEGHSHVGEIDLVHGQFVGIHQGQVDLAFVDHAQEVADLHLIGLVEGELRHLGLQRPELLGLAAALEYQDALADHVLGGAGADGAVAVDDLGHHVQIAAGEFQILAIDRGREAGGGDHRAVRRGQAIEEVVEVVGGADFQAHLERFGEALDQFVFEAGLAVTVLEIGRRTVARHHAQDAGLLHLLQRGRLGRRRHVRFPAAHEQGEKGQGKPGESLEGFIQMG